jgi:DHA1 family inner membrane transport protein
MNGRATGALAGLAGGTFLYTTAEALPVGLMIPMGSDLSASAVRIGALVTVYGAVVMVASVPLTALVRRVPRRSLLSVLLAGFVVSTAATALTDSYALILAARVLTAGTHALFWAVVVPTAASMFPPGMRGRVVAAVFSGGTVALALGVPAGTWLGTHTDWRVSFLAVAGAGAVVLVVVAALLPSIRADEGHAAHGSAPDARRFWLLVAVAALGTAGAVAPYTYVAPFITGVSGIAASAVGGVLLVRGLASVVGVYAAGALMARNPWGVLSATVAVQVVAHLGLFVAGGVAPVAVALLALSGLGFAGFTTALGALVLDIAPGRSDIAAAAVSASVNVGSTAGAFVGGVALAGQGAHATVLVGAALGVAALGVALGERWMLAPAGASPTAAVVQTDPIAEG